MNILVNDLKTILKSDYLITIFSNTSSYLFNNIEDINWCGFYIYSNDELILGPFQGKPACEIIHISKGVCGYCARTMKTIIVDDVHTFPGHIACDSESNSEIVIPIIVDEKLFALLDIDSKKFNRFSQEDKKILEDVVHVLEDLIKDSKKLGGIL